MIAAFLDIEAGLKRAPIAAHEVAGIGECLTADGDLRTLPSHLVGATPEMSGLDGFYAARLVKS